MSAKTPEKKHTVLELIGKLKAMVDENPNTATMEISLEGCDCIGEWNGKITVEPWNNVVLNR